MLHDLYSDLSKSDLYFRPAAAVDLCVFFHASGVVCVVEGELDINSELLSNVLLIIIVCMRVKT